MIIIIIRVKSLLVRWMIIKIMGLTLFKGATSGLQGPKEN